MTVLHFRSSGDLVADRRYFYAQSYFADGDVAAAAELYLQTLELVPDWAEGWAALGVAREALDDIGGAIEAWRQVLRLEKDDVLGASLHLARLGDLPPPDVPPSAYVATLFDAYAERFETALVEELGYRTPWALADILKAEVGTLPLARALDLGCGTGLMGEAVVHMVSWLEGVDLSPDMVERAARKDIYQSLGVGDVMTCLTEVSEPFDLITAADVFVYLGALGPLFKRVAERLTLGGLFAFSVEKGMNADWALGESLRYQHSETGVRCWLGEAGLDVVLVTETDLRMDRGVPVKGLLVLARRPVGLQGVTDLGLDATEPEMLVQ